MQLHTVTSANHLTAWAEHSGPNTDFHTKSHRPVKQTHLGAITFWIDLKVGLFSIVFGKALK